MKTISINGTKRETIGSKDAKALRKEGNIPCVIYGGKENIHFFVGQNEIRKVIYTPNVYIVNIKLGDSEYKTIMQDIQFNPLTDIAEHIDFIELNDNKPVTIKVPVRTTGVSEGVRSGGKLSMNMRSIKIKALPNDLPDFIEIAIDNLKIGDSTRIKDLSIDGVEFLDSPSAVVVAVKMSRKAMSLADSAESEEATEETEA